MSEDKEIYQHGAMRLVCLIYEYVDHPYLHVIFSKANLRYLRIIIHIHWEGHGDVDISSLIDLENADEKMIPFKASSYRTVDQAWFIKGNSFNIKLMM